MTHVVFGAGGGAGSAVARVLAERGETVRAVTRSGEGVPEGVERVRADAGDPAEARRAAEGAAVVYHCVNVPYERWTEVLPGVMDSVIGAAESAGARLVYCDNLYMYGRVRGAITEESALDADGPKGRLRIRLAETLLEAHRAGRVDAAIGRGSDFFGPGAENTVAGMLVFSAVADGKKAHWLGSLDRPHSQNYTDDFARGLITLGREDGAAGSVWHIPPTLTMTGREFIERVFRVAGQQPRMSAYPRWMIRLVGIFDRSMRELPEVLHQFEDPFVLDGSKYEAAFGPLETTPVDEAIERTLAWHGST